MAKGHKNPSRKRPRRSTRRSRSRRGMSSLPPLTSFNGLKCNTVLRSSVIKGISENMLQVVDFTTSSLFASYPQLTSVFKEVKVCKVKVWLVTTLSSASSGVISLCVTPKDLVNSQDTYAGFSCTPGVMTRKSFQTLHGLYYPTEPDERNWFLISAKRHLFTAQIWAKDLPKPTGTSTTVDVQLIYDAHVMFRGRVTQKTSSDANLCEFEMLST